MGCIDLGDSMQYIVSHLGGLGGEKNPIFGLFYIRDKVQRYLDGARDCIITTGVCTTLRQVYLLATHRTRYIKPLGSIVHPHIDVSRLCQRLHRSTVVSACELRTQRVYPVHSDTVHILLES